MAGNRVRPFVLLLSIGRGSTRSKGRWKEEMEGEYEGEAESEKENLLYLRGGK